MIKLFRLQTLQHLGFKSTQRYFSVCKYQLSYNDSMYPPTPPSQSEPSNPFQEQILQQNTSNLTDEQLYNIEWNEKNNQINEELKHQKGRRILAMIAAILVIIATSFENMNDFNIVDLRGVNILFCLLIFFRNFCRILIFL